MVFVYHHTNAFYEPGDLIQAGNWGRVIRGWGGRHKWFLKEALYESIRGREFAAKPSRLESSFTYKDRNFALGKLDPNQHHLLYEVRPADDDSPLHEADLHWIDDAFWNLRDPATGLGEALDIARNYWTGTVHAAASVEVVVGGPLRVVRLVHNFFA
jgi:hypothetical protein